MTPEQRLDRVERILVLFVKAGRRVRGEYRHQSHEQNEKINILIQTQMETEETMRRSRAETEEIMRCSRAETEEIMRRSRAETEEILKRLAVSQTELAESQKRTDKALRAFINSHRRNVNGQS